MVAGTLTTGGDGELEVAMVPLRACSIVEQQPDLGMRSARSEIITHHTSGRRRRAGVLVLAVVEVPAVRRHGAEQEAPLRHRQEGSVETARGRVMRALQTALSCAFGVTRAV